MQGKTCEDTMTAVTNNVMDEDWKTRGGSIWNHGQDRFPQRLKCRATTCQLVQLVKFMEQHKELAVSHVKPFPGSEQLWDQLAEHINQFGPPKTGRQCKTTWRDLRKRVLAMMRGHTSDKSRPPSRALHGMAPQIIKLLEAAGALPPKLAELVAAPGGLQEAMRSLGSVSSESSGGQVSTSEAPPAEAVPEPTPQPPPAPAVVKPEKTSSGDHLIIRVTDKLDSKTNVFNRFSVRDGHFENNVIVKEEHDPQPEMEESTENMDEGEDQEFSREEMFPAAEAILGDQTNEEEERNNVLREINGTLRRFVSEYSERTQLMRERLDLDRARLQFDMQAFSGRQNDGS